MTIPAEHDMHGKLKKGDVVTMECCVDECSEGGTSVTVKSIKKAATSPVKKVVRRTKTNPIDFLKNRQREKIESGEVDSND